MRASIYFTVTACFLFALLAGPAAAQIGPYDHIHLNVPDVAAAGNWYEKYFDGKRLTEGPNRFMFGSTRLIFTQKADAKPSAGGAIDHIGFSVRDIDAKIKELQAAGVKVTEPVREAQGLFKLAFIEDPWGAKIEVVQDPETPGFHHAHLRAPDPEDTFKWLQAKFGGQRTKMKGRIDALKYSAPGFSDVWFLVQRGENQPSEGRAIDHIGMRSVGPLAKTIDALRGQGVTVTTEPRELKLPNGPPASIAFVAGPAGVRVEIVERPGLKPGQ